MTENKGRHCDCPSAIRERCRCNCASCKCFDGFRRLHVIMASAGTGKTFRLAMRFIQLLCFGVDPAEILAVTFTKKAAGEIFDKIINRLLDFAETPERSDACREAFRAQFVDVLRRLLKNRRELQIGTIDSFFRQLTDAYAPELGIWGSVSLIDAKDDRYRRRTLRKWLRRIHDNDELDALRELLKMANRDEQKSFSRTMDDLIDACYPFYLAHGTDDLEWGRVPFLFGSDDEALPPDQVVELAGRLREAAEFFLAGDEKGNRVAACRLTALAEFCASGAEVIGVLPPDVKKLFKYLDQTPHWEHAWATELVVANTRSGKLKTLIAEYGDLVRKLFCHIRAVLVRQARIRSNAVYQLMKRYDLVYHREVRSAGLLTFADIPYLLQTGGESSFRLFANDFVNLEERLDAKLNHYLFDEFQDTSDLQWNAFDDLLNELVNDPGDRFRTFFCVGDIKQSIYRFRQGNPRLFYKVLEETRTEAEPLQLSYRSTSPVLALVNRVFEKKCDCGFLNAVDRLQFQEHAAHRTDAGFSALVEFQKNPENRYDARWREKADFILQTLMRIQPFRRGMSVGILMRSNRHLREFAQILQELIHERKLALNVTVDGTLSILDSQAVELFLQLLILARHPEDASARVLLHLAHFGGEALSWEKWGESLGLGSPADADALAQMVRYELDVNGIVGVADRFLAGFGDNFDDFDRRRFEALRRMAGDFSGDPDDFRDRLQWQEEEEKSLAGSIQLMTIHKSKGLDFDLVFLPELNSRHGGADLVPEVDLPAPGQYAAHPRWIGYLPDDAVAATIPAAADHFAAQKAEKNYDDACTVYVGLTRAKRALYLLLTTPGEDSQQPEAALVKVLAADDDAAHTAQEEFAAHLHLTAPEIVSVRYAAGREDFFAAVEMDRPAVPAGAVARDVSALRVLPGGAAFARPSSAHGKLPRPAEDCFESAHGAEVGTLVHAWFEKIEFLDDRFNREAFFRENPVQSADADEAKALFTAALAESEITGALHRPAEDVILWREKDFLQQTADGVVSGTFDRVVLYRENGRIVRAEILDYKSDRLATAEDFLARHARQLQLYRDALAALTQLAPEKIDCALLALRLGRKISVPGR